jgi:S-adenosylmethionine hydrolase
MPDPLITLTTDFGTDSPYVAAMKGVIACLAPAVRVIDITHCIAPQNVRDGALILAQATPWFPAGTIHVAVVDPGVGTSRRVIYAEIGTQRYIAPDNGLLCGLAREAPPHRMFALAEPAWWLPVVSRTFHGRDIMAPVAAHLSQGLDPTQLGPAVDSFVQLDWPEVLSLPGKIVGQVVSIDSFGNLITNITADQLKDAPRDERLHVHCDEHETQGLFATYGEQPEMTLIALVGSSGFLELAIVGDSAHLMLGVRAGTQVTVTW